MKTIIELIKNYYLRIGALIGIYFFTTPAAFAITAGQKEILEFRKTFQNEFMSSIQKVFYDHEFLRLSGGFLGGVFGILCVYAISMEIVRTHDESKRLTNLTNIALHIVFVFWIFGEMTPPTRVSFPGGSGNMGSYLKSGSIGLSPARGGQRLSGKDLDYSYRNQRKTIDRDFYQFLAKTFDEISALYFGNSNTLSERFGELQIRQSQFLDSFTYMVLSCNEADALCRQTAWKLVKNGYFDPADADRLLKAQADKEGKDTSDEGVEEESGFGASLMRPIMSAITEVKAFFLKVVSPGWILNLVLGVASFFRDLAQIFITLIFAMFVPLTFFFVKLFSIFLVVPKLRPKIWSTYKSLFAWTLFGFVSNLTMYIFIILLDALNNATLVSMDNLINGSAAASIGPKILSVLTTNSMFSLAIILLQLFAISKIPDWCRKLMDLNVDFAIGAGQSIMNMAVSMATGVVTGGVGLAATAVPGVGTIAGAGIRKAGKGVAAGMAKRDSLRGAGLAGSSAAKRRASGMAPAGVSMAKGGGAPSSGSGFGGAGGSGGSNSVNVSGGQLDTRGQGAPISMFKDKSEGDKKDKIQGGLDSGVKDKLGKEKMSFDQKVDRGVGLAGRTLGKASVAAAAALPALTKAALTGDMKGFTGAMTKGATGVGGAFVGEGARMATEAAGAGSDMIIDKTVNSKAFDSMFGKKVDSAEEIDQVMSNNAAMLAEGKAEVLDDESEEKFDDIVSRAALGKSISSSETQAINQMRNNTNLSAGQRSKLEAAQAKNAKFKNSLAKAKTSSVKDTQAAMDNLSGLKNKMGMLDQSLASGDITQNAYDKQRDALALKEATALNRMNQGLSSGSLSLDHMQEDSSREQMSDVTSDMSNRYLEMETANTQKSIAEFEAVQEKYNSAETDADKLKYKTMMDSSRESLMTKTANLNNSERGKNVLFNDGVRTSLAGAGVFSGLGLNSDNYDLNTKREQAMSLENSAYDYLNENSANLNEALDRQRQDLINQRNAITEERTNLALSGDFEKSQALATKMDEMTEKINSISTQNINSDKESVMVKALSTQERLNTLEAKIGEDFNYLSETENAEYENYKKQMVEVEKLMNNLEISPKEVTTFSKELAKKMKKSNKSNK